MASFLLGVLTICTLSWTVAQEEIFKEFRSWCLDQREVSSSAFLRKLWYLPTCHYCLSFWMAAGYTALSGMPWRWYMPSIFIANVLMTLYGLLRQQQKKCSLEAKQIELLYLQKQIDTLNRQMSSAKLILPDGRGRPAPEPEADSPEAYLRQLATRSQGRESEGRRP